MKKLVLALILLTSIFTTSQANSEEQKISRYPVPQIETLPEDIQKILKGAKKNFGFIPNVLKALAHRPAELRAFITYYKALTHKKSGITKKEREMPVFPLVASTTTSPFFIFLFFIASDRT